MTCVAYRSIVVLIAAGLGVGCGGNAAREERVPISGRVTYAGKPVTEGRIIFYPEDGRRLAMGAIDATGRYALTTYESEDGAFLGEHQVVIDAVRETSAGPASPSEEIQAMNAGLIRLVPPLYADRRSTPLHVKVTREDDAMDFVLPR